MSYNRSSLDLKSLLLTLSVLMLSVFSYSQDSSLEEDTSTTDTQQKFHIVEQMPIFPGCEDLETNLERSKCSEEAIYNHIALHTIFPEEDQDSGLEGKVFVRFVINIEGNPDEITVLRGVKPSLDQAAIEAVKSLPTMTPATQSGKVVPLIYTIPIKFSLD